MCVDSAQRELSGAVTSPVPFSEADTTERVLVSRGQRPAWPQRREPDVHWAPKEGCGWSCCGGGGGGGGWWGGGGGGGGGDSHKHTHSRQARTEEHESSVPPEGTTEPPFRIRATWCTRSASRGQSVAHSDSIIQRLNSLNSVALISHSLFILRIRSRSVVTCLLADCEALRIMNND